jgi:hypothetical protein
VHDTVITELLWLEKQIESQARRLKRLEKRINDLSVATPYSFEIPV